ncbi:hypothetical protein BGZ76_003064, partial [Entomortierella beljakovae]
QQQQQRSYIPNINNGVNYPPPPIGREPVPHNPIHNPQYLQKPALLPLPPSPISPQGPMVGSNGRQGSSNGVHPRANSGPTPKYMTNVQHQAIYESLLREQGGPTKKIRTGRSESESSLVFQGADERPPHHHSPHVEDLPLSQDYRRRQNSFGDQHPNKRERSSRDGSQHDDLHSESSYEHPQKDSYTQQERRGRVGDETREEDIRILDEERNVLSEMEDLMKRQQDIQARKLAKHQQFLNQIVQQPPQSRYNHESMPRHPHQGPQPQNPQRHPEELSRRYSGDNEARMRSYNQHNPQQVLHRRGDEIEAEKHQQHHPQLHPQQLLRRPSNEMKVAHNQYHPHHPQHTVRRYSGEDEADYHHHHQHRPQQLPHRPNRELEVAQRQYQPHHQQHSQQELPRRGIEPDVEQHQHQHQHQRQQHQHQHQRQQHQHQHQQQQQHRYPQQPLSRTMKDQEAVKHQQQHYPEQIQRKYSNDMEARLLRQVDPVQRRGSNESEGVVHRGRIEQQTYSPTHPQGSFSHTREGLPGRVINSSTRPHPSSHSPHHNPPQYSHLHSPPQSHSQPPPQVRLHQNQMPAAFHQHQPPHQPPPYYQPGRPGMNGDQPSQHSNRDHPVPVSQRGNY